VDFKVSKPKVICLSGPTASGKTALSFLLAKHLDIEIISADAVQVYRGLDIGSAKPTPEERRKVPHFLVDVCDIGTRFDVSAWHKEATDALRGILKKGKVPVVVGGAGFYIDSLLYGLSQAPPSSSRVVKQVEERLKKHGAQKMYSLFCDIDPEHASTIHPNDHYRLVRAWSIFLQTGNPVSHYQRLVNQEFQFNTWILEWDREILYQRINQRCIEMMDRGLLLETRELMDEGTIFSNSSARTAIGYKHAISHLKGELKEFLPIFQRDSRRYAKRQGLWFRKWEGARSLRIDDSRESMDVAIQEVISRYTDQ